MNRALQRRTTRRFSARKSGGGYGMGAPLVNIPSGPGSDWSFAVKAPINQDYDDCAFPSRPGELYNQPNPALAQVAMVGGGSGGYDSPMYIAKEWPTGPVDYTYKTDPSRAAVAMAGGGFSSPLYEAKEWPLPADVSKAQTAMAGGRSRRHRRGKRGSRKQRGGAGCGLSRRQRGGGCGCTGSKLFGGSRRNTRRQRGGGTYGFATDPSVSVGGSGPNVAPLYTGVPCDGRAGAPNMMTPAAGSPDPRAPADLYSLTTNRQVGGGVADGAGPAMVGSQPPSTSYGHGNAYGPECYKAPGSELPVYNADVAGFNFRPSTEAGGTLPDGVTAYNDVVPQAARVGGGRRRSHKRRGSRRSRKAKRGTAHRKH